MRKKKEKFKYSNCYRVLFPSSEWIIKEIIKVSCESNFKMESRKISKKMQNNFVSKKENRHLTFPAISAPLSPLIGTFSIASKRFSLFSYSAGCFGYFWIQWRFCIQKLVMHCDFVHFPFTNHIFGSSKVNDLLIHRI